MGPLTHWHVQPPSTENLPPRVEGSLVNSLEQDPIGHFVTIALASERNGGSPHAAKLETYLARVPAPNHPG